MDDTITLTPGDYAVLERIPMEWWDENVSIAEIARLLNKPSGDTARRIRRLVLMGVVQRRHSERGPVTSDIRRLKK